MSITVADLAVLVLMILTFAAAIVLRLPGERTEPRHPRRHEGAGP